MKKLFLVFHISFSAVVMVSGQDYEKFKVGFGSGFTLADLGEEIADGGIDQTSLDNMDDNKVSITIEKFK